MKRFLAIPIFLLVCVFCQAAEDESFNTTLFLPDAETLYRPFDDVDAYHFLRPDRVFYPEVWIDCLCGNLSKEGILADLESIAEAGFKGVQMFFGNRGGAWPGVEQTYILSPQWEEFVQYAAAEAHRLGLRFTLQNCPGWAMAGGPWVTPENAMRHLVWSRTDVVGTGRPATLALALPTAASDAPWRDYHDVTVLAFPTPLGDTGKALEVASVQTETPSFPWQACTQGAAGGTLAPSTLSDPHSAVFTLAEPEVLRTVEFSSVQAANHWHCYEPEIHVKVEALLPDGTEQLLVDADMPQSNWQDDKTLSLACNEPRVATDRYRISIANRNAMNLSSLRLFTAARKNSWESEAAWALRSLMHGYDEPAQQRDAYAHLEGIIDLTTSMAADGTLQTTLPDGLWTILRIGHVNTGKQNAPATPEATGWECNKYDTRGADQHFEGYIGRLTDGILHNTLDGMLLDSWECETQTWTAAMEEEFERLNGYALRPWMPALMGYVIDSPERTARFLHDWRAVINELMVNRFYGHIAQRGHDKGLTVTYETAAGDVFPADIMEYFKYSDMPMCEYWVNDPQDVFVGTLNFKPIKPTASAARLYGKLRVEAEAFTSMQQTWDEQLSRLREVANMNSIEGVTHLSYQAYTHNPRPGVLVPGSSFGDGIGTPFMRAQTWWRHMGAFNDCTARTSYMLERGRPVSDVLWYLGDEIDHKPSQEAPFPQGFKYDYCNPDVLLHRLSVVDGCIVTPEGLRYRLLWLPDNQRMLPETLEKMVALVTAGATVVGDAPKAMATLVGGEVAQARFEAAVKTLWGDGAPGAHAVGKGRVISGTSLQEALAFVGLKPDVKGDGVKWLHRHADGADWYFVCSPTGKEFHGTLSFHAVGAVELWDPLTGNHAPVEKVSYSKDYTSVGLDLARGGSLFVVIRTNQPLSRPATPSTLVREQILADGWTLSFPEGWGAPAELKVDSLLPWCELPMSDEARAFSGTATYRLTFDAGRLPRQAHVMLDLGQVGHVAVVKINGVPCQTLWMPPYSLDLSGLLLSGTNELEIEVTSTWFNRLVYDVKQPEADRKTWTTNFPPADASLRPTGLMGPVTLRIEKPAHK